MLNLKIVIMTVFLPNSDSNMSVDEILSLALLCFHFLEDVRAYAVEEILIGSTF